MRIVLAAVVALAPALAVFAELRGYSTAELALDSDAIAIGAIQGTPTSLAQPGGRPT